MTRLPTCARKRRALAAAAMLLVAVGAVRSARALPVVDLTAALRVDEAYDSNVFNGRGPDVVTRIAPRLVLDAHDLRLDVKLGYDLGLWFYALSKAENSVNHHGVASIDYRLTRRLNLHLGDEVIYARDPGFLYRAGVVAPQTAIFDNTLDALLAWRITRLWELGALYSFRRTRFGAPPPGSPPLYDGDEHDGALAFGVHPTHLDELRLTHRVQYFTADDFGLAVTHSPTLAWRHRFTPTIELKLEAGPIAYQQLDTGIVLLVPAGQTGWTWRAGGVLRFNGPRVRASLTAARDLVGGTGAAAVLWAEYVYAQVIGQVSRSLELRAGGGLFANGLAPQQARLYDGFSVDAGVDWALIPEVRLGAYYSFRWQEANAGGAALAALPSITRHIAGVRLGVVLGAEAHPPRRPRNP